MAFSIDAFSSVLGHWSAESIVGLSDGDNVTTVADTGPSGCTLTGSVGNYPTYVASAKNGYPGIRFNGTNSRLTSTVALPTAGVANPGLVMVFRFPTSPVIYDGFLNLHTDSPPSGYTFAVAGYSGVVIFERGGFYCTISGVTPGSWMIADGVIGEQFIHRGLNGRLGAGTVIGNPVGAFAANLKPTFGLAYSTLYYGEFDLCEAVLFDQTEISESVWITGHLAHKYAITLDANHPFYSAAPTTQPGVTGSVRIPNIRGGADQ